MSTATLSPQANSTDSAMKHEWWNSLRHGGLLLDGQRLSELLTDDPVPLNSYDQERFRRRISQFLDSPDTHRGELVRFVMEVTCGFKPPLGLWHRAGDVSKDWTRKTLTGEAIRPNHLWIGKYDSALPVFIDKEKRIGIGKGKKAVSNALQWLRQTDHRLAIVTNGHDWRLLFAGLDYEAFAQWDLSQWFSEGEPSDELNGFRSLVCPRLWAPETKNAQPPLLQSVNDSRKGQAELSQVLGERVRQAVELLVRGNSAALEAYFAENKTADVSGQPPITPSDIYRAGVRMIMRMVVVLFAESRERLLPRDNPIYHDSYSLGGLRDQLERVSPHRLKNSFAAYPRIISLFRLIYEGCPHPDMTIHSYGGQLFEPGNPNSEDGMLRALHLLEQGCYHHDLMNDAAVHAILDLLSRTKIKIRQGRQSTWVPSPVDFSSLDSEYIGILYEGLLDFELRQATVDNPIIFLAVGNQPALPLSTLEAMDDKALKNLLDKMKDTSSGDDDAEDDADEEEEGEPSDEANGDEGSDEEDSGDSDDDSDDVRQTTRARAEAWAHRAIEAGKLVNKPRGTMTEEKKLKYKDSIDRKARQIVTNVILPGEWYLVRWGGTRKGSGTFYTRPQLAVPTVHRTLRPLAYDPPLREPTALVAGESASNEQDQYDFDAPIEAWIPKRPEQILDLKVCDPACGSGSFPLAALRFLTEALFASLHHYDRIEYFADRTVIDLIRDEQGGQTLAGEALPCRPEDIDFEPRTKAVLRRYVVERCIYGVDLDPLAVELCRLSLWIETLDPRLPFTFLDHKIKCGNSLIGTWFDQFMHYPLMAWMREGGDKNHSNGVHFEKEAWTKAIKAKVKDVKKELIDYIDGAKLIYKVDLSTIETVHDSAEQALQEIHQLGIHEVESRAQSYRSLRESAEFLDMKFAFDLWCCIWFWPPEQIESCPLPIDFYENELDEEARTIVSKMAMEQRFFHWELEFPDVFNQTTLGFSAVIGNPPWETLQPNSQEYFSSIDPLYRSYGNQQAKAIQKSLFEDSDQELNWLHYVSSYRDIGNWVKSSGFPYGNHIKANASNSDHQFSLGDRGRSSFATSEARHEKWKQRREESSGYADQDHPFSVQGSGKCYTHKMFLEQGHALLTHGGRLGLIVPSGVYSDHGSAELRNLFVRSCRWDWLYSFINWDRIFTSVYYRFKFCILIIQKKGTTTSVNCAFGRYHVNDWENAEQNSIAISVDQLGKFSPKSLVFVELRESADVSLFEQLYSKGTLLADQSSRGNHVCYTQGDFNMTSDSKLFPQKEEWESNGFQADEYSRWIKGRWQVREGSRECPMDLPRWEIEEGIVLSRDGTRFIHESEIDDFTVKTKNGRSRNTTAIALPLYEGRMIGQFDFSSKEWISGKGRSAVWKEIPFSQKRIGPQYLMAKEVFEEQLVLDHLTRVKKTYGKSICDNETHFLSNPTHRSCWLHQLQRVAFMDIASATNERTMIAALACHAPYGHAVPLLYSNIDSHFLLAVLNSVSFDSVVRSRCTGLHLTWSVIAETVIPNVTTEQIEIISALARRLNVCSPSFAPKARQSSLGWRASWALSELDRTCVRLRIDAILAWCFGLNREQVQWMLRDCDYPSKMVNQEAYSRFDPKGFWRIDKGRPVELRYPILVQIAFASLENELNKSSDANDALRRFAGHGNDMGWQIPSEVTLSDYDLGHGNAATARTVAARFSAETIDSNASVENSWKECLLHARNLVGIEAFPTIKASIEGADYEPSLFGMPNSDVASDSGQEDLPLFQNQE